MSRSTMLAVAIAMALLSLVALVGCVGDAGEDGAIEGSVLAVLSYSPDEVVLIESESLAVIKRVRLRSMGTDPLALPGRRTFVTAQCGGLGTSSDDVIALIDLHQGGRVRYVDLPVPNPGFVESAGDGDILVSCGIWDTAGIPVMRIDLDDGAVVNRATIANAYDTLVVAAGSLWTVGPEGPEIDEQTPTVRRTSLDLTTSEVAPTEGEATLVAADGESTSTILAVRTKGSSATISRLSATSLEVLVSGVIDGLHDGVYQVIEAGEMLVLRDSNGAEMANAGGPLIVLDRTTLRELHRVDVGGSVASIVATGEAVYAVTWDSGELVKVDAASGTVLQRVRIGGLDGKMLQLAAMEAERSPGSP